MKGRPQRIYECYWNSANFARRYSNMALITRRRYIPTRLRLGWCYAPPHHNKLALFVVLFSFASLSRIENISITSRRDKKHNKLWREPPAMIEFIYKSLSRGTLNTGYKPRNISKSHTIKQRYDNKEKQPRVNWSVSGVLILTRSGI